MQAATAHNLPGIQADCGGLMTCGTCHVLVREPHASQLPPPHADELAMLDFTATPRQPHSRLSCQITRTPALDGLTVDLPATQYQCLVAQVFPVSKALASCMMSLQMLAIARYCCAVRLILQTPMPSLTHADSNRLVQPNTGLQMILEIADIRIHPGQQAAFEEAIQRAIATVASTAKGFEGFKVNKGIESPERYVLQIFWTTLEDHTAGFRQGPLFPQWRAIVGPFFAVPPVVEHFELVAKSD